MLTINRFDASAAGNDGSASASSSAQPAGPAAASSRLAALAQRKRKREEDGTAATSSGLVPPSSETTYSDAPQPPKAGTGMPMIHPSRLATAPILAREMKKAAAAAGVQKEKTKAKQRYLKKKKQRRKAKIRATGTAGTAATGGKTSAEKGRPSHGEKAGDGEDSDTSSDDSDSDAESIVPNTGSSIRVTEVVSTPSQAPRVDASHPIPAPDLAGPPAVLADQSSSSSSSSSSHSDTHSASDSSSDSDSDSDSDVDASMSESQLKGSGATESAAGDGRDFLAPLDRSRQAQFESAEAIESLAQQGLPRGMARPQVVDAQTRGAVTAEAQLDQDKPSGLPSLGVELEPSMAKRLQDIGVTEWFAVQTAVVPHLLACPALPSPFSPPRDLCVSAPTGSGKTLAYSIPIISHLRSRIVMRLRALVILPTRDLVSQVRETLESLSRGTGLRIGSVTGLQSFAQEQALLVDRVTGESKLDILISTPGRLIDHLDETAFFTLEHLRFLVIDEADRLLGQSFHDWAQRIKASLEGAADVSGLEASSRHVAMSSAHQHRVLEPQHDIARDPVKAQPIVQKLLFSATLARDPGKLAELGLRDPVFIDVRDASASAGETASSLTTTMGQFSLPSTLHEHMIVVPTASKPLHLLHLLLSPPIAGSDGPMRRTLVFTKSVDSALRLVRLLEGFLEEQKQSQMAGAATASLRVADYSSDLSPGKRRELLQSFKDGQIDVLVASDLISRGIDLPLVENVVSYDAPVDPAKYVHRVGRTARANREGNSWCLVETQEARFFKGMLRDQLHRLAKVKRIKVEEDKLDPLRPSYEAALQRVVSSFRTSGQRD